MTGKGDRWGRDSVGRSAPAFLAASTTALPPSTCTARREAGQRHLRLLFAARPAICGCLFLEACAGRRVRRLCPPAVVCSAGCVPARLRHAIPTALLNSLPPFSVALPLFNSMCARIVEPSVCKLQDCPIGSCNTGLQRRPVRRFCDFFFSCRVHDPGPWCSVNL